MTPTWSIVYDLLKGRIESFGIAVIARRLPLETTGIFDGLSITTNTAYDLETRCYNIAHSLGHIVQWSVDYSRCQALYNQLHAAKANKKADAEPLRRALERFRRYEEEASQYATWLLMVTGNAVAIPAFINFPRADIEAIVAFHRDGAAPIWHVFFADWNAKVAQKDLVALPFGAKPIPRFTPVQISAQEVIQGVGNQGS
jgi:hypothetical protein